MKYAHERFINKLEKRFPNKYKVLNYYDKFKTSKLQVLCKICGDIFETCPKNLYRSSCANCFRIKRTFSHKEFIFKVKKKHKNKIIVLDTYITAVIPIRFKCSICSTVWKTKPGHILDGHGCPHCCRSGPNSGTWQGGLTTKALTIRHSKKYKNWRTKVFIRDKYTCRVCGKIGRRIEAHHINSFNRYPNQRFNINNGITLCIKHHNRYHKKFGYNNYKKQFTCWLKKQVII